MLAPCWAGSRAELQLDSARAARSGEARAQHVRVVHLHLDVPVVRVLEGVGHLLEVRVRVRLRIRVKVSGGGGA